MARHRVAISDVAALAMSDGLLGEIRAEMARQRVTISDLAPRLDMSPTVLGRRLAGRSALSITEAEQIADALGFTLLTLIDRADEATG